MPRRTSAKFYKLSEVLDGMQTATLTWRSPKHYVLVKKGEQYKVFSACSYSTFDQKTLQVEGKKEKKTKNENKARVKERKIMLITYAIFL
jgi:hypothetical protein